MCRLAPSRGLGIRYRSCDVVQAAFEHVARCSVAEGDADPAALHIRGVGDEAKLFDRRLEPVVDAIAAGADVSGRRCPMCSFAKVGGKSTSFFYCTVLFFTSACNPIEGAGLVGQAQGVEHRRRL